ncbi:hypothetical protein EXIGLDRAFT_721351 [Exidia glandulosa HHB12029]|uniref:Uncharacterized protein n=1 Tax=Exidia glandulosa HHB12029 TaxID=1314781 RepID=A0A165NDC7_EXIGL|nr:hypothetical protein EXIGLDRAFT_721351 [Exidia glandulosa HHB12029]
MSQQRAALAVVLPTSLLLLLLYILALSHGSDALVKRNGAGLSIAGMVGVVIAALIMFCLVITCWIMCHQPQMNPLACCPVICFVISGGRLGHKGSSTLDDDDDVEMGGDAMGSTAHLRAPSYDARTAPSMNFDVKNDSRIGHQRGPSREDRRQTSSSNAPPPYDDRTAHHDRSHSRTLSRDPFRTTSGPPPS